MPEERIEGSENIKTYLDNNLTTKSRIMSSQYRAIKRGLSYLSTAEECAEIFKEEIGFPVNPVSMMTVIIQYRQGKYV